MDGSIVRAWWASGGLQAPRMRCGAMSLPSLAFIVAATSISVRTPNPCSARAARVRSTVWV